MGDRARLSSIHRPAPIASRLLEGSVMRIAVLGAAASALMGGTLAVTPLTSVSTPLPAAGGCGTGGAVCEKVASVLMPETPKSSGAAADAVAPHAAPFSEASNVIAPGVPAEPGVPSAAAAVPGVGGPGVGVGGGVPAVAGGVGLPDIAGMGVPDVAGLVPGLANPAALLPGLAGLAGVPSGAAVALSVVQGVVGVGGTVVGVGSGLVGTVTSAAIALTYLHNLGVLPNLSLPSLPGISLPTAAAAIPGAAAAIPAVAAAVPQVGLPAAPALPALPALPAAPALPGLPAAPALPALPALPAPPPLPGPPAIPHPQLCTPGFGPIGICTP
ncbi:hypothetical protein K3U93_19645 [Mycobacterium malmoense]|nr:hypothetical protein K3U93_19645 [Mycobacterium malmoense]UNB93618.1 hypothetical protein H5T25_19620 [Mycobacterium malmoense]